MPREVLFRSIRRLSPPPRVSSRTFPTYIPLWDRPEPRRGSMASVRGRRSNLVRELIFMDLGSSRIIYAMTHHEDESKSQAILSSLAYFLWGPC